MKSDKLVFGVALFAAAVSGAKTVRVSDFGHDPKDSTRFVQAAFDSGARRVIVDNIAKPWYVTPLEVRSNTEIVFEKGAAIAAKYGSFKDEEDVLLKLDNVTNVTIRGGTAVIYRDDFPISVNSPTHGWQHVIGMFSAADVTVEDMELRGAGGDGIYLGCSKSGASLPCRDIVVRRCDCVRNNRQGISVISADGLLIEDTVMRETGPADPSAGIDIEPNYPGQVIRNIVMRNCLTKGNRGNGYEVAVMYLNGKSASVDILLENCRSEGDRNSLYVRPCYPRGNIPESYGHCAGRVRMSGCMFSDPRRSPVAVQCSRPSRFFISSEGGRIETKGRSVALDDKWLAENCPLSVSSSQKLPQRRFALPKNADVVDKAPGVLERFEPFRVRGPSSARYVVYASKPGTVRIVARQWAIGRIPAVTNPIKVTTPDGRSVAELKMPQEEDAELSFNVQKAGFYRLEVEPGRREFSVSASNVPIALDATYSWIMARDTLTPLWVYVPAGCRGAFFAGGSGSGGMTGVTLLNPLGETVWKVPSTDNWKAYVLPEGAPEGLWKFKVETPDKGPVEDFVLDLAEIPGFLFLSDRRYWREKPALKRLDYAPKGKTGKAVQAAIDEAAAAGGGRVVLEQGTYPSGTIYLKSHVELHLKRGAVLLGGNKPDDYDDVDDVRLGASPEGSLKVFIVGFDLEDVAITGEGVIDGQGLAFYDGIVLPGHRFFRKPAIPRPRMAEFLACRGLRFEGVTFKDSPGWTFWFKHCENILFEKVTVCGDKRMVNNDGLDIDSCRHVRIVNCDISTGDDCLAFRAIRGEDGGEAICEDVVVSGCRLRSACQCVRIGCPSDDTIRDILVEDSLLRGHNAIVSDQPYGYLHPDDSGYCRMANIRFERIGIDVNAYAILFRVEGGIRLRDFGHVGFKDVSIKCGYPIELIGSAESPLSDIRFENVRGEFSCAEPFRMRAVRGVTFDRCELKTGLGEAKPLVRKKGSSWETKRRTKISKKGK